MSPAITSTKQTKPKSKKSFLLSLSLSLSLSGKSFTHSVHSATPKFQYLSCKPIIANPVVNPPFPSLPFTVPIPSFSSKKQVADSISPTCILALPTMEAFSLLKYWRGSGGINSGGGGGGGGDSARTAGATTIVAAVTHNTAETDEDEDDDDGPFFDLEFAVPDEEDDAEGGDETQNREQEGTNCENESDEEEEEEEEREFNFTLSSGSSNDRADPNLSLSPSDDLFFKGRLVPIEPSSLVFNPSEPNSKQPQLFPVSLLKSATKFRVSMLGLKKSKTTANAAGQKTEPTNGSVASTAPKPQQQKQQQQETQQKQEQPQSKSFTVKFKVEEVPIVSLFTRDSSRSASGNNKAQNKQASVEESASDEKRFSKDVMHKYLKKVKPLYVRVSRRYGEKLRFSGQLNLGAGAKAAPPGPTPAPVKPAAEKGQAEPEASSDQGLANNVKISQKLRVVCKHLGKSRSASSAAVAAAPTGPIASKRRDDSLLQQQDGIQSAILHCKRSFNASRGNHIKSHPLFFYSFVLGVLKLLYYWPFKVKTLIN
jgi:hypothetical protein